MGAIEDRLHGILAGSLVGGDVEELLGGPRGLAPEHVDQSLAGGFGYQRTYDVGVRYVGDDIALLREPPDVVP